MDSQRNHDFRLVPYPTARRIDGQFLVVGIRRAVGPLADGDDEDR